MEDKYVMGDDLNSSTLWSKYKRIWWFYYHASKTRFIKRTGRIRHLVNEDFSEKQMLLKPEDVAEHQNTTSILWAAIITMFPTLFNMERAFFTTFLAAIHDVPEGMTGVDCADDGNPSHDAGKANERIQMEKAADLLSETAHQEIMAMYDEFEKPTESKDEMIVALKMVDKLDAILGLLADEKRGIFGAVSTLSITPSERDLKRAEYLGTSAVPDNWMFGLRKLLEQTCLKPEVKKVILGVAWAAFMDVRMGDVPYCLTAPPCAVD